MSKVGNYRADYYRWRKQYGGMKVEQARRFKEWEYTARSGLIGKRYPGGDEITLDDANWGNTVNGKDKWRYCSPVGSFEAIMM